MARGELLWIRTHIGLAREQSIYGSCSASCDMVSVGKGHNWDLGTMEPRKTRNADNSKIYHHSFSNPALPRTRNERQLQSVVVVNSKVVSVDGFFLIPSPQPSPGGRGGRSSGARSTAVGSVSSLTLTTTRFVSIRGSDLNPRAGPASGGGER